MSYGRDLKDLRLYEIFELNYFDKRFQYNVKYEEFKKLIIPFPQRVSGSYKDENGSEQTCEKYKDENGFEQLVLESKMNNLLKDKAKPLIFFKGWAGTGKTTFLNLFCKDFEKQNIDYKVCLLNFNEHTTPIEGYKMINVFIRKFITGIYDEIQKKDIEDQFLSTIYEKTRKADFKDKIRWILPDNPNSIDSSTFLESKTIEILQCFLISLKISKSIDSVDFSVLNELNTESQLFICILLCTEVTTQNKFVFVFDNVDALSQVFIAQRLLRLAINLEYVLNQAQIKEGVEAKFILSLREINKPYLDSLLAVGIGIETNKRVLAQSENLDFNVRELNYVYEILKKRSRTYYYNNPNENNKNINIIIEDNIEDNYNETLIYLFNYNIRVMTSALAKIVDKDYDYRITADLSEIYEPNGFVNGEIKKEPIKEGIRGCVLLHILEYLSQTDDDNILHNLVAEEIDLFKKDISPFRLIMTLLCNLSQNCNNDVSISDVVKRIKKTGYSSPESLKSFIKQCYTPSNEQSLLMFKKIKDSFFTGKKDSNILEIEEEIKGDIYIAIDDNKVENKHLFNVGYQNMAFVKSIYIHYEWFNFLCYKRKNKRRNTCSLFEATNLLPSDKSKYVFEQQIEDVFNFTRNEIKNTDRHFCEKRCECENTCEKDCQKIERLNQEIARFKDSDFCYSKKNGRKLFYNTRIISRHVTYLEKFRKYLFNSEAFSSSIDSNKKQYGSKSAADIQIFILDYIEKYLTLYCNRKIKDSLETLAVFNKTVGRISEIKQAAKNNTYLSIEDLIKSVL
ncbi:MAG: hypothetical protein LBO06_08730 [Bacteroidales bacterium]|jgi:hypothetical protein|nr:hypothetical protein [Bacteroidales bacterium]